MNINRRRFITASLVASAGLATPRLIGEEPAQVVPAPALPAEIKRGSRQDPDLVLAFVQAGHSNLPAVKEMVAQHPALVFATWDWGAGDWETALGGASHLGNREIARYLLSKGARIDAFCAAMLGARDAIAGLIAADPTVVTAKGPHGFTLLYHVAISGDIAMADLLKPHLAPDAKDYNQALHAAVRDGHLGMTQWLFANGTVDPNSRDGMGRRATAVAREKGFTDVYEELRRRGGTGRN